MKINLLRVRKKKKKNAFFILFFIYSLLFFHFFEETAVIDFNKIIKLNNLNKINNLNLSSKFFELSHQNNEKANIKENTKENIIFLDNFSSQVYFCPKDNCEEALINLTVRSLDVKCALFDLGLEKFIKSLENKDSYLIIDNLNKEHFEEHSNKSYWRQRLTIKNLKSSSILMHNKFCIFDNKTFFTGSFNPTNNGAYKNDNSLLVIHSNILSKEYAKKFDELMSNKKQKKNNLFLINDSGKIYFFNIYFCPEDNCDEKVIDVLKKAKKSVKFMTFSFTDDSIGEALVNSNISVYGIFESKRTTNNYSEYSKLKKLWPKTILKDNNKYNMHNKFFIIDNSVLITGSYNPTWNGANNNDENIIITNYPDIVNKFKHYFKEYFNDCSNNIEK